MLRIIATKNTQLLSEQHSSGMLEEEEAADNKCPAGSVRAKSLDFKATPGHHQVSAVADEGRVDSLNAPISASSSFCVAIPAHLKKRNKELTSTSLNAAAGGGVMFQDQPVARWVVFATEQFFLCIPYRYSVCMADSECSLMADDWWRMVCPLHGFCKVL